MEQSRVRGDFLEDCGFARGFAEDESVEVEGGGGCAGE